MLALAEDRAEPRRPLLPLSALPLAEGLGPVVMADDACEAASATATPPGASKYYRARYYDPKQGRFINEDPIGFSGGLNFYSYVGDNPINATDPSGQVVMDRRRAESMFGPMPGPDASPMERALWKLNVEASIIGFGIAPLSVVEQTATAGSRLVGHHVLPQAFRRLFERAGIDIDKYLVKIPQEWHQRWVHSGGARGGRWNAAWRAFFEANPEATADEIWGFLLKTLEEIGLCGS